MGFTIHATLACPFCETGPFMLQIPVEPPEDAMMGVLLVNRACPACGKPMHHYGTIGAMDEKGRMAPVYNPMLDQETIYH